MSAQQRTLSRKSALSLFVTTVSVMTFGGALEGQAQVDLNTQERLLQFNLIPLVPSTTDVGPLVCKTDVDLILHLWKHDAPDLGLLRLSEAILRRHLQLGKPISEDELKQKLNANKAIAANILQEYFQTRDASLSDRAAQRAKLLALPGFPITFCEHQGTVTQPTTVKISFPFTSTYETNVLKSNQNVSSGTSSGLGGTLQMITAGLRPYDVMALSAGTTSVRYNKFSSKSFDAITTQGAYQFFLDAFDSTGAPIPGTDGRPIDPKLNIPPPNMITVDAVAFGFQNQTSYRPTFHRETIDLFTPQVTLSRQNWSLAGKDADNRCWTRSQDPRKDGFCHYIDLSLTVGQTFSDVKTQQNANVAVSATPGWRIPHSDWKLTLPATATARFYENFPGGRQDVLLQTGAALTYAPDAFKGTALTTAVQFSVSATYNRNFSSVPAAAWQGLVVLPTLTIAFAPSK